MPLASANRTQLGYMPEVTFGVTPVAGNYTNLRMTGESLNFDVTKENDKEITADGQMSSVSSTGAQAAGDIKVHMQYAEYDRFFAGVMRAASWTAFGTNGVGASFTSTHTTGTLGSVAATITASVATSGNSLFTTLKPGQWFKFSAPGNGADGAIVRVSTSVPLTSMAITLDVNTPLPAAGTAVATCSVSSSRLVNGVALTPFSIERQVTDTTPAQFMNFRGMHPSKFSTSFAAGSLTEGTFTFLGKDMQRRDTTSYLPGTAVASQTYNIQNAVTGVGNIWENGSPLASTFIKSLSLDMDSGLRAQTAIGTLGLVGVGIGTFMAKGTMEVYFANGALFDKFLSDVFTSVSFSTRDAEGNGYVFTFPRVQLTSAKVMAGGKDTDLMASFEYTAYGDKANANPALRFTLLIDRFGAAVLP